MRIMPQAQLIDINTAAITHRNGVLSGITNRDYAKTIRHLKCYNAALPLEYKITIDTEEYNDKIKKNIVAVCGECKEQIPQHDIKMLNLLLPPRVQLVEGHTHDTFWVCPKCKKDNRQTDTLFIQDVQKQPFYLRCVPEPPKRKSGIGNRITFDLAFEEWASNFLEELEEAAAKYRQEYKPKDQNEITENNLDLSMEDQAEI